MELLPIRLYVQNLNLSNYFWFILDISQQYKINMSTLLIIYSVHIFLSFLYHR